MAETYNVLIIEVKEPIADIITAKQGDTNSRFLDVYLKDNGRPINLTGNEVKLYGKKQDGKVIFNNGTITDAVNGRCQFELTSQALAVAGNLELEISIWQNNEKTLTTQTFKVFVVPRVGNDRAIESSNEFGALVLLFQNLNDFIQDASHIIERIGITTDTGGTNNAGTVMAKLNNLLTNWTNARAIKIDTIDNAIGKTNDSGGTNTAGTVMAKLNKLLTDWTNARAVKIDNINDNIGQMTDTNGTTTTGTVMAKLNKLLTDWTNSRATKIDTINTNVSNLNTRVTNTRASRLDNIGTTTDTGGTATAGTIMAKLNKIITDEANSGSGDIGTVNDNIGKTTDTGGTSTAGTVMAKLNKLLTDWTTTRAGYITNLNSRLTSTRAGYLDKLANFGATTDTGGTATAGTLMAKVNKLLGSTVDITQYKISNIVRLTTTKSLTSSKWTKIYQFHAKYDGCICAYAALNSSYPDCRMYVMRSLHDYVNAGGLVGDPNASVKSMTHPSVYTAAVGSILSSFIIPNNIYHISNLNKQAETNLIYGSNHYQWSSSSTKYTSTMLLDTTIPVKKGEDVAFIVYAGSAADVTLQIKYDEVKV